MRSPERGSADHRRLDDRQPANCAIVWSRSRALSAPLVNEVIIGLPDKDKFNASQPKNDAQFAKYVTNPTLPD